MNSSHPAFPRVLPFALFMACIGLEELLRFVAGKGGVSIPSEFYSFLYPVRLLAAGGALIYLWKRYSEIEVRDLLRPLNLAAGLVIGLAVFYLWIRMDWLLPFQSPPTGYDPSHFSDPIVRTSMTMVRLFGAAVVVPVMEELFWRSFLLRYLIDQEFTQIPIGQFTWPSFLIASLLFGLEHQYIVAGIMAGVAYSILLYFTRSIAVCILSHAVTNLALGIYVIATDQWQFW